MLYKWPFLSILLTTCLMQAFGDDQSSSLHAEPSNSSSSKVNKVQPMLEIKSGYFFFSDAKMRKVYDEGGLDVQISGSYPIWRWLQIYGSVEYLTRHGRSLGGHQKARIWEVPLSLGLKPVITISPKVQYYLTLGPRYFFIHAHHNSPYVDREINPHGLGGFVNTGFNFFPFHHLFVDIFGEYSYKRVHFHPSKHHVHGRGIQVGGFAFGAGLGYAFGGGKQLMPNHHNRKQSRSALYAPHL